MVGTTVSHYKILEKLGEGGMGVVYSAEDSKLKRTVALKFLPKGLEAHEPERSRFLQEAQAAAALNHPHICTIHDIQEHEGQQFIVMEHVDGVTLRQKITGKGGVASALPLSEAVSYALQIGDALQEAHGKGIIHRDIKADNIMVTPTNQVKVMDFGLAKLKGSLKLTKTSSTVGTLAYMAPEHIEGKETDARADIFSFGIVLYEMLTGHLPFRGEHDAAMMYSIVSEQPDPVQKYVPDAPSELTHILSRALEKDPEDRYQTVRDMVIDLRRLKKETGRIVRTMPTAAHPEHPEGAPLTPAARPSRRPGRLAVISLVAVVVVAAAGVIIVLLPGKPHLNPDMKSRVVQIPFRNVYYADMSRDGNWLVFPAADEQGSFDVYMMNLSQGQPRRITFDSCYHIYNASLSPDAGTILYSRLQSRTGRNEIVSVSSTGGAGRVILEDVNSAYWLPDGSRISYTVISSLSQSRVAHASWTCRGDGSDRRFMFADTMGARPGLRNAFAYSPDGRSVAWTKNFPDGSSEIMLRDLESGTDRQLTFDRKVADDPLWTPSDHLVFASNRGGNFNLWTIPATGGEPDQLTRGSGPDQAPIMTADGKRLMYSEIMDVGQIKIASLPDGTVRQLTVEDRLRGMAAISPDGRHVAFPAEGTDIESSRRDIYVMDRNGQNVRQLTDDDRHKVYPSWSVDGQWIAYGARLISEPDDSSHVYIVHAEKPGQPRTLGRGIYAQWLSEKEFVLWSPSGTWRGAIDSPACARFSDDSTLATPVLDGRYVVTLGTRGRGMWCIVPAESYKGSGGEGRVLINRSTYATFARGGREMYYAEPRGNEIRRISLPDGKEQTLKAKLPGLGMFFSMSSDCREIAYTEYARKTRFVLIENPFR